LASCSGDGSKNGGSGPSQPNHLQVNQRGLVERIGGRERVLVSTGEGAYVNGVAISPDGKRLAFVLQPPASTNAKGEIDFGADLYIANRDGSERKEIVHHSRNGEFIFAPAWLPDGESLIYIVRGRDQIGLPDFRLESINLRDPKRVRLIDFAVDAALSHDGKSVAYVYYDPESSDPEQFLLQELGSKAAPRSLVPADSGLLLIQSPAFSPDGSKIAFAASNLTARLHAAAVAVNAAAHPTLQDIWVVNRDGSNLHKLAEIVESQPSVDWSADGNFIYALGGSGFWKVEVAGGAYQQIGPGEPGGLIKILGSN
jgi:Tol biopolymer transport system component